MALMCLLRKHDLGYGNDSRQNGPFDLAQSQKQKNQCLVTYASPPNVPSNSRTSLTACPKYLRRTGCDIIHNERLTERSKTLVKRIRQRNACWQLRLLAAQAAGVSSGSFWMDELARPGRTVARYSRTGILSRRQVSTIERIAATRGPAFS